MKTEVNYLFSVWHQRLTAILWALKHSDYHSSWAISVNITLEHILDLNGAFFGEEIYGLMWSAAKRRQTSMFECFKKDFPFSPVRSYARLVFCWLSQAEQTQMHYTLSLGRPALTVEKAGSKWEADDTDSHKMETPLGRQTLQRDNCYLIAAGKRSHGSPFFFFYTVSTLWESKYFSDYPPCALIHMVHSVCHRRC